MNPTAGRQLRRDLDAVLAAAVKQRGPLVFDEVEEIAIAEAMIAADRAEQLRAAFDDELAGEARSSALTRLSAEARQCSVLAVTLARSVTKELLAQPKSEMHQRAVRARWDNRGARHG
ncbi:hypothetical protein [Mycolicibacterium psychrotolerans]|uniref:Uncharacterized protein n=1 Tax=Mycolicibacterium psychrotolerans TaxID=216929 RepID=A0A7I7MBP8_9MYCO|nr:hypothetical protein [Mycolicibacterium psychrotolerans]BBX69721.1 hypothetical protein MPSYJ_31820 [Mycolicibacterium psychrotolerans]